MATAIRQLSSRLLVDQRAIQFIRAQTLTLSLIDARPNTQMNVFFGEENVNHLCVGNRTTNPSGAVTILLSIPGGRFNVGTYDIVVTDAPTLAQALTTGTIYGSGKGRFTASGRTEIYQTTVTTIIGIERPVPPPPPIDLNNWTTGDNTGDGGISDPLAQSFFTYGVTGGMFLSSIDLFFATKDQSLPVRIELRPMVNGYPLSVGTTNRNFISMKAAADVNVSSNASAATKFTFDPPIYLKENSDYCFIVRSNSSLYQLYTSRMGEVSIETGRRIFEQPYVGSIFKSENSLTWTAEQFEDIKFRLNKAVFSTSPSTVTFTATTPYMAVYGDQFSTTSGSNVVTYTHPQNHGLSTGSKLYLYTDPSLTYNGISSTAFNVSTGHTVTVVDDRVVTFNLTNANATGALSSGGKITYVAVSAGGSGYVVGDLIETTADIPVGTVSVVNDQGAIVEVELNNTITGLTTAPSIRAVSTAGTGAALVASVLPRFVVSVNKPMMGFIPHMNILNFGSSSTTQVLSAPRLVGGNVELIPFKEDQGIANLGQQLVVKSGTNNQGSTSATVEVNMLTDNSNVTPIIDIRAQPSLSAISPLINNDPTGTVITSELAAAGGDARARYVTQKIQLQMISNGMRLFSTISSTSASSVSWFVRTSLSSSGVNHDNLGWVELTCDVARNRSSYVGEFYEYEFKMDSLPPFDTYDLKCVMLTNDQSKPPIVSSYRVIVLS